MADYTCPTCGRRFLHKGAMQAHQNKDHGAAISLVYVDDMCNTSMGRHRGMKMSHMISDDLDTLHAMADQIGMRREWFQGDHYDVGLGKRQAALEAGAIKITMKQAGMMVGNARAGYPMGTPDHAAKIAAHRFADRVARAGTLALTPSWWTVIPSAPDAANATQYCRKIGTSQCAAICLSWWPAGEPGKCPHALQVWGPDRDARKSKAILKPRRRVRAISLKV